VSSWRFQSGFWAPCVTIPLEDRGFRYGMSVFETVAVRGGRPLFLSEHLERIGRAANARRWANFFVPDFLPELTRGQGAGDTGVFRIYLTAGSGGVADPLSGSLYALFEECEVGTNFAPLRLLSSSVPYFPGPGGWKTGNYWQNVEASAFARESGADDALLFNPAGGLVCASMANVFLEVAGGWKTPALEAGPREGVVRAWAIENLPAEESLLDADSLARATACFVSNSRIGIRQVRELEGRALPTTAAGALQNLYRKNVLRIEGDGIAERG